MNNIKEKEKGMSEEEILKTRESYKGKKITLDDIFSCRRNELKGKTGTIIDVDGMGDFKVKVDYDNSEIDVMVDIDDFTIAL